MKLNRKRKGFTLVELIVVVVILGILMGIGALKYADVKRSTNLRVLQTNNKTLVSALQLQAATNGGKLPSGLDSNKVKALAQGIEDQNPVGAKYTFSGTTLTVEVPATDSKDNYPKNGTADPGNIKIVTNISDGTVNYSPSKDYFINK